MRGLLIPVVGSPEIITQDLQSSKLKVFSTEDVLISTFDGKCNYYHYPQNIKNILQPNVLATFLKRIYTNNYTLTIRGDILVYSSADGFPNIIDDDVPIQFLQQVVLFTTTDYEKTKY